MTDPRPIKKYPNRRLYDCRDSRSVTIADLRRMIAAGDEIQVIDDKTGADITHSVLLQIVTDGEADGSPILSKTFLHRIIRLYGNPMQGLLARYLESSAEVFMHQQEELQHQFSKMLKESPVATMATMAKQNLKTWTDLQQSFLKAMVGERDRRQPRDDDRYDE